jgi:hypothetical protein
VQAVGGGPVTGSGGELPPELGALGMPGQVQQAREDGGALDVQLVLLHGGGLRAFGQPVHVGGGAGTVEDPAGDHGQVLAGLSRPGHVRRWRGLRRIGGQPAQRGSDVEGGRGRGRDKGVGEKVLDRGGHCPSPFLFLPGAAGSFSCTRSRSLPLRPW